jgi:AraC-like DNA-binding protein
MATDFRLRFAIPARLQHLPKACFLQVFTGEPAAMADTESRWLLLQCLHGSGRLLSSMGEQSLAVDQALLIAGSSMPCLRSTGDARFMLFGFSGVDALAEELSALFPVPFALPVNSGVTSKLLGFGRLAGDTDLRLSAVDTSVLVSGTLAGLLQYAAGSAGSEPRLVRQACRMLQGMCETGYDGAAVAEQLHVSPEYFCRIFTDSMGVSPGQYHKRLRLGQAARLLKGSRLSVQAIAERLGYTHQSALARAFRSLYDVSPQEFRDHGSVPLV